MPEQLHAVKLAELTPNPVNKEIYGPLETRDVEDLKESITEYGLLKPLVVSPGDDSGYTIISGHQRYQALKELGFDEVNAYIPDRMRESDEIIRMIIENQYRQKTNEQRIREGMALEEAEKEKARARQAGEEVGEQGAVRDIIAARIGMSGRTYDKGKDVVEQIDSAEDEEEKEDLRAKLNKSVNKATQKEEPEDETEVEGMPQYWKDLQKAISSLEYTYHKLSKLRSHTTSVEFGHMVGNLMDMANRLRTWDPKLVKERGPGQHKESQY